jgi:hypothetical protein
MFVVYWIWPREEMIKVEKPVSIALARQITQTIKIGDQVAEITIPYTEQTMHNVSDTIVKKPTRDEWLRFTFMLAIGGLLGCYFLSVLVLVARAHWRDKAVPKSLEIQLAASTTYLMGIISAFLITPPPEPSHAPTVTYSSEPRIKYEPAPTASLPPASRPKDSPQP